MTNPVLPPATPAALRLAAQSIPFALLPGNAIHRCARPTLRPARSAQAAARRARAKDQTSNAQPTEVTTMPEFTYAIITDTNRFERHVIVLDFDAANGRVLVDIDGDFAEHWIPISLLTGKADRETLAAFTALFADADRARRAAYAVHAAAALDARGADFERSALGRMLAGLPARPALRLIQGGLAD